MPHDELKPKDRVVLRMTRDGAVEENLTEGTSEKVSKRLEDAQLVAPHDTETGDIAEEIRAGVDYTVDIRCEGAPTRKASSIIMLGEDGEVKIIRE